MSWPKIAGAAAAAVVIVALATFWSLWSVAGVVSLLVVGAGLVTGPWRRRRGRWRGLTRGGLVALAVLFATRVVVADEGENLRQGELPGSGSGRVVDRLVEEQDIVISAAPLLGPLKLIPRGEGAGLTEALRREYARMRAAEGAAPSPFASTALSLDGPESFDLLWHEVRGRRSTTAVVFLHGFGGSFALPCWEVASAAARAGMETACPSIGQRGDWWTPKGERITRETIRWLRARGATRVVLAGLSNGGIGASRLAPRLRTELAGLVLISGAAPVAPPRGVPVLVVHGRRDRMTSPAIARQAGRRGKLVMLDGDHFVLVTKAEEIQRELETWLAAL